MLKVYGFIINKNYKIVIYGKEKSEEFEKIINILKSKYIPNKVILFVSEKNQNEMKELFEISYLKNIEKNKTKILICTNDSCLEPLEGINEIEKFFKTFG